MLNVALFQIPVQPAKQDFTYPYDSSRGISSTYFWTALIILGYLGLRFYLSLKKDKKQLQTDTKRRKKQKRAGARN